MLKDLTRLALAVAAGALIVLAYTTWRIWDQGNQDDGRPADAIVVLGAAQYNGVPSPIYQARLDHAIDLYEEGLAPALVVTGGKAARRQDDGGRGRPPVRDLEGRAGRRDPRRGPAAGRRSSRSGRSRRCSATATSHSAVFVSDRTHMLRVLRIARDEGIEAFGSPTRTSPIDASAGERLRATVHEVGALALYFLAGNEP